MRRICKKKTEIWPLVSDHAIGLMRSVFSISETINWNENVKFLWWYNRTYTHLPRLSNISIPNFRIPIRSHFKMGTHKNTKKDPKWHKKGHCAEIIENEFFFLGCYRCCCCSKCSERRIVLRIKRTWIKTRRLWRPPNTIQVSQEPTHITAILLKTTISYMFEWLQLSRPQLSLARTKYLFVFFFPSFWYHSFIRFWFLFCLCATTTAVHHCRPFNSISQKKNKFTKINWHRSTWTSSSAEFDEI